MQITFLVSWLTYRGIANCFDWYKLGRYPFYLAFSTCFCVWVYMYFLSTWLWKSLNVVSLSHLILLLVVMGCWQAKVWRSSIWLIDVFQPISPTESIGHMHFIDVGREGKMAVYIQPFCSWTKSFRTWKIFFASKYLICVYLNKHMVSFLFFWWVFFTTTFFS